MKCGFLSSRCYCMALNEKTEHSAVKCDYYLTEDYGGCENYRDVKDLIEELKTIERLESEEHND